MMKYLSSLTKTPIAPAFFFGGLSKTCDAYLDLGTGSLIVQILIGTFVGGIFAVKLFWSRIKTTFMNLFFRGKIDEEARD